MPYAPYNSISTALSTVGNFICNEHDAKYVWGKFWSCHACSVVTSMICTPLPVSSKLAQRCQIKPNPCRLARIAGLDAVEPQASRLFSFTTGRIVAIKPSKRCEESRLNSCARVSLKTKFLRHMVERDAESGTPWQQKIYFRYRSFLMQKDNSEAAFSTLRQRLPTIFTP